MVSDNPDLGQAERIIVALIPHKGHNGIPGAPEGVLCLRCTAERALNALAARLAQAERIMKEQREEMQRLLIAESALKGSLAQAQATLRGDAELYQVGLQSLKAQLAERERALDEFREKLGGGVYTAQAQAVWQKAAARLLADTEKEKP